MHDHRETLMEEVTPGEMWDYDVYWNIPSYAPSGSYTVTVSLRGHQDNENTEDHYETLSTKGGNSTYRGKHKVFNYDDLPEDTLTCLFLEFDLER